MWQAIPWLLAILACAPPLALAEEGVPLARDLQHDARQARAKQGAVLVVFSRPNCPYCTTVLNEFLIPMSRNADYQNRLVLRRVDNSAFTTLRDFDGRLIPQRQFADAAGVKLVPTVMLFDAHGHPLGKPLVGISSVDYYGYFLDQAIDAAVSGVRRSAGEATLNVP